MRKECVVESDVRADTKLMNDICVEVLNDYLKYFKMAERAMRKLPGSLTRKERTELVYYQEMVRNIGMVKDYIDTRTESINFDWDS
jgi:hypothetical protein